LRFVGVNDSESKKEYKFSLNIIRLLDGNGPQAFLYAFPENSFTLSNTSAVVVRSEMGRTRKQSLVNTTHIRKPVLTNTAQSVLVDGDQLIWSTALDLDVDAQEAVVECDEHHCQPPIVVVKMDSHKQALTLAKLLSSGCGEVEFETKKPIDTLQALRRGQINLTVDDLSVGLIDGVVDGGPETSMRYNLNKAHKLLAKKCVE
jgi:hypothetical protein